MSSTDHAEAASREARSALSMAEFEEATSITHAMVAQAHATLALVDQQRISNLIAFAQITGIRQEHRESAIREARVALGLGEAVS